MKRLSTIFKSLKVILLNICRRISFLWERLWVKTETLNKEIRFQLNIFGTYEKLQVGILNKTLSYEDIEAFRTILKDDHEYTQAKKLLEKILTIKSKRESNWLYKKLYKVFTLAHSHTDVFYWYLVNEFNAVTSNLKTLNLGDKKKRRPSWSWLWTGYAAIIAYNNTGEERFLQLFISTFDQFLYYRDDKLNRVDHYRGRIMKSWGAFFKLDFNTCEPILVNTVTFTGGVVFPVCKFCKTVLMDESLKKRYGEKAKQYLKVIEEAVSEFLGEFVVVPEINGGYFKQLDNEYKVEPLNHSHYFGATLLELYFLTGNGYYLEITKRMSNYFLASITKEDNGSYSWGYRPTPNNLKHHNPEPLWKARRTIILPLTAYECGIIFNDEDMKAFAKTFTSNVHVGENKFNIYISKRKFDSLQSYKIKKELRDCVQGLASWILLDIFDPSIRHIIEKAVAERTDLFPKGYFSGYRSSIAYAHRLGDGAETSG